MTLNPDAIEWSDSFLLGFTPMDNVHEEFVNLIGQLQAAEDAQLPELFDALTAHLEHHFGLEDQWMIETDFPPRDCHGEEHAAVLKSVREVSELLRAGNVAISRDLVNELANWFPSHADHLDSALAHWMSKLRFGG
jgi:hemerythrin-like metal-binding protein